MVPNRAAALTVAAPAPAPACIIYNNKAGRVVSATLANLEGKS
jgi:hypothetical protein